MDIDQIKTFLAVAAHGRFLQAAERLHVTQSTVSARIGNLERVLGARLFVRNRQGATLTPAGQRFVRHAKTLMLTFEQARHEVGLPSRFRASLTVGARIALWDDWLPRWARRLGEMAPDVSLNTEIGFEDELMRRVVAGTLDLALMYGPRQGAGLRVEPLFDEQLILVGREPVTAALDDDYIYVDWGPTFYAQHRRAYPEMERPARTANIGWLALQLILSSGGSCFVPDRVAMPYLRTGRLRQIPGSPQLRLPAYVVYADDSASAERDLALALLREMTDTASGFVD
ncbi:LysR family transcriptional regulator [Thiorhodovibrio winogradskyi]|nr:LysR family transcriptional regulator [Thiorhodovibrio winogradskyi]